MADLNWIFKLRYTTIESISYTKSDIAKENIARDN